jgi:hypothetical protein
MPYAPDGRTQGGRRTKTAQGRQAGRCCMANRPDFATGDPTPHTTMHSVDRFPGLAAATKAAHWAARSTAIKGELIAARRLVEVQNRT